MTTPREPGAGGPDYRLNHGRKMSRRRSDAAKRKQRQPFLPDFHGLERRMMPATFLVNTTADSGPGSLRQAILDSMELPAATRSISASAQAPRPSFCSRPCRAFLSRSRSTARVSPDTLVLRSSISTVRTQAAVPPDWISMPARTAARSLHS